MAKGIIVRRGGKVEVGEPIPAPTIIFVSRTTTSLTFTIRNNSIQERDITYGLTTPPTTTTITLAADATSANQTITNLDIDTEYTIYAQAADGTIQEVKFTTAGVFIEATGGTTLEYDSGGKRYRSHTFTSSGTFTVTNVGETTDDRNKVDYLIIAGGGGGARATTGDNIGGGGGAGGYRTTNGTSGRGSSARPKFTVSLENYTVTVGLGGAGNTSNTDNAQSGFSSSALGVSTTGGGGGGGRNKAGSGGGSGGGGNGIGFSGTRAGGAGLADEGFDGGTGIGTNPFSAGGGGAGQAGNGNGQTAGGNGLSNILRTGSAETRGGGGGGGGGRGGANGAGGSGGGGNGGTSAGPSQAGTINTGGGGGGGADVSGGFINGANGGSGVVIIRYEIKPSV